MQAGFPVAAQAPVALQPRQIIPPLPTGTERTLVAVPQFGVALANALANDPPVDQATVPAAQSATSGQDILAAMSVATANPTSKPIPMPGLQASPLDSPTGAAPAVRSASVAKSQVANRAGSVPQDATEQVEPPAVPPSQTSPASPLLTGASTITAPTGAAVSVEKAADDGQQLPEDGTPARSRRATGAATAQLDQGNRVAKRSVQQVGANHVLPPVPQSIAEMPRNSPHAGQTAPSADEAAALRRSLANTVPALAMTPAARELRGLPRYPSVPAAPLTPPGNRSTAPADPADPPSPMQISPAAELLAMPTIQGLPAAGPPADRNQPPGSVPTPRATLAPHALGGAPSANLGVPTSTMVAAADEFRSAGPGAALAAPSTVSTQRLPPAIPGIGLASSAPVQAAGITTVLAAANAAPGATATVGIADTVAPTDLSGVAEAFPPPLPGPVQPATVPPTGIAIVASSIVEAAAGAVTDDSLVQTRIPQIVQAEAAASSPSVPQTGPSLPLAKVSGATRTTPAAATKLMVDFRAPHPADPIAETRAALLPAARPTSRAPANHGPLSTTAPTGSPPTASESPMTATPSGRDIAGGPPSAMSVQPSPPIAIDAAATATPFSALLPAAVAAPEDTSPASRPASPAAQMAPVLVSLGHKSDGTQRLTMRLDPPELGRVQVCIDRPAGARRDHCREDRDPYAAAARSAAVAARAGPGRRTGGGSQRDLPHRATRAGAAQRTVGRARAGYGHRGAQRRRLARRIAEWRPA
jgi:hypothetical protein